MKNIAFFCEYARNGQRNGRFISCRSEPSPPETATVRRGIRSTSPEAGKADSDSSDGDDAETPPIYLEVDSDITFNFASNLETVHSGQGYFSHFLPSLPSRSPQFVVILVGCQRSRLSSVPSIPTQACSYVFFLSSPSFSLKIVLHFLCFYAVNFATNIRTSRIFQTLFTQNLKCCKVKERHKLQSTMNFETLQIQCAVLFLLLSYFFLLLSYFDPTFLLFEVLLFSYVFT